MPMNFTESPIPPYSVVITSDVVARGYVNMPQARGDKAQCEDFIAKHLPPKGYELDIMQIDSGMLVSFMLKYEPQRIRLQIRDCIPL